MIKTLYFVNDLLLVNNPRSPFSLEITEFHPLEHHFSETHAFETIILKIANTVQNISHQIKQLGLHALSMRELLLNTSAKHHQALVTAFHLYHWTKQSRFCGQCAKPLAVKEKSTERVCLACELSFFPKFSPAMMVLIERDDQILLANGVRHPEGVYSALAGFVEPGETLEACLHREVMEEVGLTVDRLHYFGSQPWPFPDCLMIAYKARYVSGEIKACPEEINHAAWFDKDKLPKKLPNAASIARALINSCLE